MRVLKWVLLALLLLQIPFACSLYRTRQLGRYLAETPRREGVTAPFDDYRGGVHVHSAQGGHSLGTYPEIVEAAKAAGCRFLFITEHPRKEPILAAMQDADILLIYGQEIELDDGTRFLADMGRTARFLTHLSGDLPDNFEGVEIYNLHENALASDTWFQRANFLYHQLYRPDLFFFHLWEIDEGRLLLWDRALGRRRVAAIAGNDAHQNVGLILQTAAGKRIFSILLDPYRYSLRFVSTHLMLARGRALTEQSVVEALAVGSAYVAFDRIADPEGFSFHAFDRGRLVSMGERARPGADLVLQSPVPARFVLHRSGSVFRELEGTRFTVENSEEGIYRLEVFPLNPPRLLLGKPWILSNPIFVRP